MRLRDLDWQCKYTPGDGDLLAKFYVPLLKCAWRYDRTTGFYSSQTLAAASTGVEALARGGGRMRLIAGCTLEEEDIAAIRRGEDLRGTVEARMLACPFDEETRDSLELLAWMVAKGCLEIKVAVPCHPQTREPVASHGIFHEKAGIVEDGAGDRLVFNGSLNETLAAWRSGNWDSFHVFCSWKNDAAHLDADDLSFQRLWADRDPRARVMGIGEAVKRKLLEYLPDGLPRRLAEPEKPWPDNTAPERAEPETAMPEKERDSFRDTWRFIHEAPAAPGGEWTGCATAAINPWPHQIRAFRRMYGNWPPRLLIADEVGLGKTIQAAMLIRQAWLAGRARRILIMAPKSVLWQWQLELREKFNLNFPVYDDGKLRWLSTPARRGDCVKAVSGADWHKEPFLLVSSHLMRRGERARQLLEDAEDWDLLILDEAHHARRSGGGGDIPADAPNRLLRLMRQLARKARGLILLTGTPMQIHPVEVWDLLRLLGLPPAWTAEAFIKFFDQTAHPAPDNAMLAQSAALFRAVEQFFQPLDLEKAQNLIPQADKFTLKKVLSALRSEADTPRNMLSAKDRRIAQKLMRGHNPIGMLVSRHTRELLRAYRKAGRIASNIAARQVEDIMVELSRRERALYEAVEQYISRTYDKSSAKDRSSVGFVMTIYRRRLASSFFALSRTLSSRLAALRHADAAALGEEDLPEDELEAEAADEADRKAAAALRAEEAGEIAALLEQVGKLPVDTKARKLFERIEGLREEGYAQVIVFTQYTDTLDFLRGRLAAANPGRPLLCFSGRGGERWKNGAWERISRDRTKEIFRRGEAEIMLCTDAAAEGLNLQFCGALINYDMPWNPMKVEQRIGRIDRLGQKYENIKIVNFMYANTVEADIYHALRERIGLFGAYVGKLQPILAKLPRAIGELALAGGDRSRQTDRTLENMRREIESGEAASFDLDEMSDFGLTDTDLPAAPYDLAYLERVLQNAALLPPGHEAEALTRHKDYKYTLPGWPEPVRVTCDREFYADHAESVELWSPGSPAFPWGE